MLESQLVPTQTRLETSLNPNITITPEVSTGKRKSNVN